MTKHFLRALSLAGIAFSLAGVALAQQTEKTQQIPGYYNPKTHTFQTRVVPEVNPDATAPKVYTGTLKYDVTVKLVTPVASGQQLVCDATAVIEDASGTFYEEGASAIAKVSGSSATCVVSIPYAWSLADGTTDTVSIGYDLEIVPTTANAATEYLTRTHTSELAPIKVPTTGATTTIPISATI